VHERTRNLVQVRGALARLVAASPDDLAARVTALDVLDRLGDLAGARAAARELEARAGENVTLWQRLSSFYVKAGDARGTARALESVSRLSSR
jgi:predicted Zn-dependent protease